MNRELTRERSASGRMQGAGAIESLGYRAPRRSFVSRGGGPVSTRSGNSNGISSQDAGGKYARLVGVDIHNGSE